MTTLVLRRGNVSRKGGPAVMHRGDDVMRLAMGDAVAFPVRDACRGRRGDAIRVVR
jgi:hypothetical protein